MELTELILVKSDSRGVVYNCGPVNYVSRVKGSVSGDHTHNEDELLYLVRGSVELTVASGTTKVSAPCRIQIEKGAYHKLLAVTDVEFLEVPR